ncbi:hypothetical protein SAMN05421788_106208 [Filimonas lacunae]|uniref:Uncharacterized protein n=1 Tax=Filimonas lacunae TaxID=477680 RepID=A0A1N7QPS6_9BACT|nr:hypothetical protein SAMN05421788_106208 [Filimonas lacunae]
MKLYKPLLFASIIVAIAACKKGDNGIMALTP